MAEPVGSATIDLDALVANLATLRSSTGATIAAIVKANAYGHGLVPVSRALVEAGADYLGVAQLTEARELRRHLPGIPIFTWLYAPGADLVGGIGAGLEISVGAPWAVDEILVAARHAGTVAPIHIEVDTGMARGGFSPEALPDAARTLAAAQADGAVDIVGLWSHLARADEPASGETGRQLERFHEAHEVLRRAGIQPRIRHLANTAGVLWHPQTHLDMVRPGIGLYGVSPEPGVATAAELGLRPVMTLSSTVVAVREAAPGTGVSYGHTERTQRSMMLGTVPLGYADGIPRSASSRGPVSVGGVRTRIIGRVCMDQVVIELPVGTGPGDEVIFFGAGGPTADEWAAAAGTIGYEMTTRIGRHIPRRYPPGTVGS
ncbi:alanine racemase [Flaviflexus huanghaiensis]|uniref:alanine racemase n=1 Tax=Flaviflexus huanghaiensis TaxID=1111473 RepID=UPI0015F93C17|nr:alanine racemase [Flaviflexus huanghaiensis]